MSNTFTVGPNGPTTGSAGVAIYQPGRPHPAVTIYNTGLVTVYLDHDNPLIPATSGLPLSAGSSIPWDADLPLYVACPTSTTIVISDNGSIGTDASAVAAAIIAQGLAQDIADAVFLQGVPPVDKFALLDASPSFGAAGYTTPVLDTTNLNSLLLTFSNGPTTALVNGKITVVWYSEVGTINDLAAHAVGTGSSVVAGDHTTWEIPVEGPFCEIVVSADSGGSGAKLRVNGSYKTLPKASYVAVNAGSVSGTTEGGSLNGFTNWATSIVALAAAQSWQPDCIAGHAKLNIRVPATSTMTMMFRALAPAGVNYTIASVVTFATTPTTVLDFDVLLPPYPIEILLSNNHATNTLTIRASITYENPF